MRTVGIRELKNRLSAYLRHVRSGETVRVTDRGEVVAELTPPGHGPTDATLPPGLLELAKQGLATLGRSVDVSLYPALPRTGERQRTAARLLDEERGDR